MTRRVLAGALAIGMGCGTTGAPGRDDASPSAFDARTDAPDAAPSPRDASREVARDGGASLGPAELPDGYPNLDLPSVGAATLTILSPTVLELELVTTKAADPAPLTTWDFVGEGDAGAGAVLPPASTFVVRVGGATTAVQTVGFRRRPIYAPLARYDLRIGNWLYLVLAAPIADGATVSVDDTSGKLWSSPTPFTAVADPHRFGKAIHVSEAGYDPGLAKHAFVGAYLGSLGELPVAARTFELVERGTGATVHSGPLTPRPDTGFPFSPPQYQSVLDADFSGFDRPGQYQLEVPGLGASYPFVITDGPTMAIARTYAEGLYNQRCGTAKRLPFTRFPDGIDHVAPVAVPDGTATYATATMLLASNASVPTGQTAPELTSFTDGLYPYAQPGPLDTSGGHHDAGDYSKYLMDSGFLIHTLTFAADSFEGAGALDNLGIPESGDGKSDILEEAKWEADFVLAMQDTDGLFFYLVYPKDRAYESDVLPSQGDPQIVWPKNTYASAAAVAALAELGSSPRFAKEFPADAAKYVAAAQRGWTALEAALAKNGETGAYQFIYQDDFFLHDDMIAWAAAALFAATGDGTYATALATWYPDPSATTDDRWGWWGMWRGWGNAARTYAFAARSGRLPSGKLDATYLAKCEAAITSVGSDQLGWAKASAYGTSFPTPSKATGTAGWYFSGTQAFDLAVANALSPDPSYVEALLTNLAYETGANPVNLSYLSGLGWQRPREMVSQFFQNDRHRLAPTGIDYGNLSTGYMYLAQYGSELEALTSPSDGATSSSYAFYDRYAHQFNTATEADTVNEGWGFAAAISVAARTPAARTPWVAVSGSLAFSSAPQAGRPVTVTLTAPAGLDLSPARVTWEASAQEPWMGGTSWSFVPTAAGATWVDCEAMLPDGRRVVASTSVDVK